MPNILHYTTTVLRLSAGDCLTEIEECVIHFAKVVCLLESPYQGFLLSTVWVAVPTKLHQYYKTATLWLCGWGQYGSNEQVSVWVLTIKVQLMLQFLLLMFPLQHVWMFSYLNNQCLFTLQSYFSHFSPQSKSELQTVMNEI